MDDEHAKYVSNPLQECRSSTSNEEQNSNSSTSEDKKPSDEGQSEGKNEKITDSKAVACESLPLNDLMQKLTLKSSNEKILLAPAIENVVKRFKNHEFKNIITMVGAGISTAAGIPDFRSPGVGLYHTLSKYNLPYPQAIFEYDFFQENPKPFFLLAKELFPESLRPTKSHCFLKLLNQKGLLLRHFTQNIDNLERIVGIPEDKLIEAHGTFNTSHCMSCNKVFTLKWMKEQIFSTDVPRCVDCKSVVKPDIIFFGEKLPRKFFESAASDFTKCDLLILMGTSLVVEPFASLVERVKHTCTRIIINQNEVGHNLGIKYNYEESERDIFIQGSCDDGCQKLADLLDWSDDLAHLSKNL